MSKRYFLILVLSALSSFSALCQDSCAVSAAFAEIKRTDSLLGNQKLCVLKPDTPFDITKAIQNISELENIAQLYERNNTENKKAFMTSISLSNYYFSRDTLYGTGGLLSTLSISNTLDIGGMPIEMGGGIAIRNGKTDMQSTYMNIAFDHAAFLQKLKKKTMPEFSSPLEIIDAEANPISLTEEERRAVVRDIQFHYYKEIINHPAFYTCKAELEREIEKIQQEKEYSSSTDSLSAIKEYKQKLEVLMKVDSAYSAFVQEKEKTDATLMNDIQNKADAYAKHFAALRNPETLRKSLFSSESLSAAEKFLLRTRALEIGLVYPEGTEYTIQHMPVNGLRYLWQARRYYAEFAFGNEGLQSGFFQNFGLPLLTRARRGRRFLFIKAGTGQPEGNHFQVAVLKSRQLSEEEDVLFLPKDNIVYSVSGRTTLIQNFDVTTELAFSQYEIDFSTHPENAPLTDSSASRRLAAGIDFHLKDIADRISVTAGLFYAGPYFITMGNPFVLTNRQGFSLGLNTSFFKNTLHLRIKGKYGYPIDPQFHRFDFSDFQVQGEIMWRAGNNISLYANYAPNIYRQSDISHRALTIHNNLVTLQGSLMSTLGNTQIHSNIGITNFNANIEDHDSVRITDDFFIYYNGTLQLSKSQSVSLLSFSQIRNHSNTHNWKHQATYTRYFGKVQLSIGGLLLKDRFTDSTQAGIVGECVVKINDGCLLKGRTSIRRPIYNHNTQHHNTIIGSLNFIGQI